ncbi:MAG: DUF2066 domain-containing protein [Dyella sp.]
MRLSRFLFLLSLALLAALPAHAQVPATGSPYQVTVPVADTSEMQRDLAFGTALGQVIARVSGGQDLRDKAGYADAIKQAGGLVQQYQYQRGAANTLSLQATFDSSSVQRLIGKLGVPAAGLKPPLLALVQGADGGLLGKEALATLTQSAAARGYVIAYPSAGATPDLAKLGSADPAALAAITQQYRTGLVLLGTLKGGSADWTLISGGQAQHWTAQGAGSSALLAAAGNAAADRLGQQLNAIGGNVNSGNLWVSGLKSAMDYANLQAVLRADPSVSQVITMAAQGDGMLFAIKTSLPISTLAANLAAGGRMLQGPAHAGADASLRWLH